MCEFPIPCFHLQPSRSQYLSTNGEPIQTVLAIGLIIEVIYPPNPKVRYMGMFFIASGTYLGMPVATIWVAMNAGGGYKRAVAIAAMVNFATAAAFISSNVFMFKEAPRFKTGFSVGLAMTCMGAVAATIMFFGVRWENMKRDRVQREQGEQVLGEGYVDGNVASDEQPNFRFVT